VPHLTIQPETLRIGGAFTLLGLVLLFLLPKLRRQVIRMGAFYVASLALRVVGAGLDAIGMPSSARAIDFIALVLQGTSFLGLAAIVLFDVLLHAVRIEAPKILRDIAFACAYLAMLLYLFSEYRVDVTGIVATSAVVTAVIGFSLQDTLANVMGGVALQMDDSISTGDWILFDGVSGIVREVRWRHTSIETRNGDTLIIPNSVLMKTPVLLQGKRVGDPDQRERRWVSFQVGYPYQPTLVADLVLEALTRSPIANVAPSPQPSVIVKDFGDSAAVFAVRYWLTDLFNDDATDSLVRTRIHFALKRAGIPFSIPSQAVSVTNEDRERAIHQQELGLRESLAVLESVSIFHTLTEPERVQLASRLVYAPFARGEAVIIQGHVAHHLYILSKGTAEVRVAVEGAPQRSVAMIQAPDFFGEMGMLTGEPRKASVHAISDVECWRLDKPSFEEILQARPKVADDVSTVLAERDVNLAVVREGLSAEASKVRLSAMHDTILGKIHRFFGL